MYSTAYRLVISDYTKQLAATTPYLCGRNFENAR